MDLHNETDEALMLRVKNGEGDAFALLVNRYKQSVVNLIAHTVGDNMDSEDIAQQVFIQVYRHAENYEIRSKFTTWLFTIAKNLSLNEIRRRKRHPTDSLDDREENDETSLPRQHADPRAVSPETSLMNSEMMAHLNRALEELPDKQRMALLLFQEQNLSYIEIANVLETSLSSTKSLIFRARETLKKNLHGYLAQ